MSAARPVPWTALLDALGTTRFEEIRAALAARRTDPADRDAFVLDAAVGGVLRDLVPADAPAAAVTSYAGLLHLMYLHWASGQAVQQVDGARLRERLVARPAPAAPPPGVGYLQLPERLVWGAPAPGAAHEPLDGLFVAATAERVRILAVLGFRPERDGFTTVEASSPLPPPRAAAREDGTAPFATVLPGGERMGFFSVTSEAELVELALLALPEAER